MRSGSTPVSLAGCFEASLRSTGGETEEADPLERKSLPDSLFVVPSGYTKLRSPGG